MERDNACGLGDGDMTADQVSQVRELEKAFHDESLRTSVDLRAALDQLTPIVPQETRPLEDDGFEMSVSIDLSGIVATLRALPDAAGTEAFVAAYNVRAASKSS